jgi:hypothetical protein
LMDTIQEFEAWSGIPVNTSKMKLMIIDDIASNRNVPVRVEDNNIPLDVTPETETVCYLGFWATPNGNMRTAMDLVVERTLRAKETIQGHPLGPRQAVEVFVTKAVGNFRYLATAPWRKRDWDRLDRYCRQGYKTAWKLNESVANHQWTTPKNMGGMGYTTTLVILAHTLHAHVDRCMRTKDVAYHLMTNDLHSAMKEWLYTSKEELTREAAARTSDETVDNVCHRLAACDHLLDLKSKKKGDPPPGQGISYAAATRHLRILRRRLEEVMGKSTRLKDPPWSDISKEQWDLLWSGAVALKKHGETLWMAGHKTVDLYQSLSAVEMPRIMLLGSDSRQTFTSRVTQVLHLPESARKLLETYSQLADWNQLRRKCNQNCSALNRRLLWGLEASKYLILRYTGERVCNFGAGMMISSLVQLPFRFHGEGHESAFEYQALFDCGATATFGSKSLFVDKLGFKPSGKYVTVKKR